MLRASGTTSAKAVQFSFILAAVHAIGGCSPAAPAEPDAGGGHGGLARPKPIDDCQQSQNGAPQITIGEGQTDYAPLEDRQTVQVEKGPQGGYHIWLALRMTNLLQSGSRTVLEATVPHTGVALTSFEVVFTFVADEGGFCKLYGLRYRIDSDETPYRTLLGRELEVQARVTDASGAVATARATVVLSSDVI